LTLASSDFLALGSTGFFLRTGARRLGLGFPSPESLGLDDEDSFSSSDI